MEQSAQYHLNPVMKVTMGIVCLQLQGTERHTIPSIVFLPKMHTMNLITSEEQAMKLVHTFQKVQDGGTISLLSNDTEKNLHTYTHTRTHTFPL